MTDPSVLRSAVSPYRTVDVGRYRDNTAVTRAHDTGSGGFNVWRNSFPAEYLPDGGSIVRVDGVPFRFPVVGAGADNVRCAGQYLPLPVDRYDWIHFLTAAERRTEDAVALHYADGSVDAEWLRVSDFWAAPAYFGEREAFRTPVMHYPHHVQPAVAAVLWAQRVPVPRRTALAGLSLPANIAVHVFAITTERSAGREPELADDDEL